MTFVNEIHTFVSTFEIEIPCLYDEIQFVIQSLMIVSQMLVVLYDTLYQNRSTIPSLSTTNLSTVSTISGFSSRFWFSAVVYFDEATVAFDSPPIVS
jgi:hypothetical protein